MSYTQGGLPQPFRDALFALENPGDYTEIIQTGYGYHIIRLEKREVLESFDESYDQLKTLATRLPRVKRAEEQRAMEIREANGVMVDTTAMLSILGNRHFKAKDILETSKEDMMRPIVTIGDQSYTFEEIVHFAETASVAYEPDTLKFAYRTLDLFLNDAALNYEAANLEDDDDEFRYIMEEFKDGLLLFKLMEDSVWTAAASDTAALMAYHAPRADSFWFPDRHRIISFGNRSDSLMKAIKTQLDDGTALGSMIERLAADTTFNVRVDTTYISEPNNSVFDRALDLEKGGVSAPVLNGGRYLVMVNDGIEKATTKDVCRSPFGSAKRIPGCG